MKVLYVASEVTGFAKTGGLADVAASLPPALASLGIDVAVMMPLYGFIRHGTAKVEPTEHRFEVPLAARKIPSRLWHGTLPDSTVPIYFVDQPEFFDRVDPKAGFGLYQHTGADGKLEDYPDNSSRFAFFSRAVLEALPRLGFWPDVLHLNDWQTGLAPAYLREIRAKPRAERPAGYEHIRTIFTIHNLAYQGLFWHLDMPTLGLPWRLFTPEMLEFYGRLNFLKAGLVYADLLTTVSPTYAREIQTPYYGCGLHGVLLQRCDRLVGIVNGIDFSAWNPATDKHIAANYTVETLGDGKPRCKAALQEAFGLDVDPRKLLFGVVSRLADQKGIDLILKVMPDLLARETVQLVVLGVGDKRHHDALTALHERFPKQAGARFELNEAIAHQIEASADAFLMPSQYEPCGLNQLYSLRYGTVPVVRATGGLADTVVDATETNLAVGKATGFAFIPYSPPVFRDALTRCLRLYHGQPDVWRRMQETGMRQDWSWSRSAAEYVRLYQRAVSL